MTTLTVGEHIDKAHKEYAGYDCLRNLPHISDGLKPVQRKIIYTAIKTLKGDKIKVSNLGSRASDLTDYQHSETSIIDAVIVLARDYCGTNHVPLLDKEGQFGTMADNEAASPRYIYVRSSKNLSKCFTDDDEPILNMQVSDGQEVEPEFYLSTMPLLLINGSRGIGNGYSSRILPRKKENVIQAALSLLEGNPVPDGLLNPSFDGFQGTVSKLDNRYSIRGVIKKTGRASLRITCLPPDSGYEWESYKQVLLKLLEKKIIKGFSDESSEFQWAIDIDATQELANADQEKLCKVFELTWTITEIMNYWGWDGKLKMCTTPEEVLQDWITGRLPWLEKRRLSMIAIHEKDYRWLQTKWDFTQWVNCNPTYIAGLKRPDLIVMIKNSLPNVTDDEINRLLSLRIASLTVEDSGALASEMADILKLIDFLKATNTVEMMKADLTK